MTTTDEILGCALALPESERAILAKKIVASLPFDPLVENDWGTAWQAEIERRLERMDRGESVPRDWRVVMDEIDNAFQERRC